MPLRLRQYSKTAPIGLGIRLVKMARCQKIFCQPNLPKYQKLLYNRAVLILIIMAGMRMTALAAGLGAAMAGGPDEANAQATEIMLPHPEREIVVDVSRVAFETQAEIMENLGACLDEGKEFADANGDGEIKGAGETGDFEWAQATCTEIAEAQFSIADSEARIAASVLNLTLVTCFL